jgi:hypothetical protein
MTRYHVTLGGQGLMLDLRSYRRRPAGVFAAKQAQGDRSYGDQLVEQVLALSDWSGGEGQLVYGDRARFRSGVGLDGTASVGALQVGPDLAATGPPAANGYDVLFPYKGKLYAGTSGGKTYELTPPVTWALSRDHAKAGGVTAYAVFRGALFAANGTDGAVDSFDGTSWTAGVFTASPSSGIRALCVRDPAVPRLYAASADAGGCQMRAWNSASLSGALYTLQEPDCLVLLEYDARLWAFGADAASRRGGIYSYDETAWRRVLDLPDNYPTCGAVWNGVVYLGMAAGGEVWSWDGSGAPKVVATGLTAGGDELRGMAAWQGALWVATRSGTEIRLKRYDGDAWSTPIAGSGVDNASSAVRGMASLGGELYVGGRKSAAAPVAKAAVGSYATAPRQLETSLFSADLPGLTKVFRAVELTCAPLASGQSIQVEYRLEDGGGWTSLGTLNAVGATSAAFAFAGTVGGKLIGLRLTLTATAGATPRLYDLLLRYVLRPPTKRRWEFAALLEGTPELPLVTLDGSSEPKSGEELSAHLWALLGRDGTLAFVDLDDTAYDVWLQELREEPAERSRRLGISYRATCVLIEA